jgi:hypothetical protein
MPEHFNDYKYRSSQNCQDSKKHVQHINQWNIIRIVFHISSFLFTFAQSLNSSLDQMFSLHCAHGSFPQAAKLWGRRRPMAGRALQTLNEPALPPERGLQLRSAVMSVHTLIPAMRCSWKKD